MDETEICRRLAGEPMAVGLTEGMGKIVFLTSLFIGQLREPRTA